MGMHSAQEKLDYPCERETSRLGASPGSCPKHSCLGIFVLSHLSLRCWATGSAEGTLSIHQEEILCSANVSARLKQKRDKQEMKLICLMELKG